jgi:tRNA-splicing ligase RtcB (3'-phosphate/5'-hydroxy nucleic acid ligase)
MSFKYQIQSITDNHHVLAVGAGPDAHIFMNRDLLDASEELLWQEVACIKGFPGVTRVAVTPDAHASGNGVPVGVAVETDGTLIFCAAGYDISCGMIALETNLTAPDVADNTKVRAWMNAVADRVALGAGRHTAPKQKAFSVSKFGDILEHGAHAIISQRSVLDRLERACLPVDTSNLLQIDKAQRGFHQVGSLGGGNHFLELNIDQHGKVWIIIHTGSRGYGHGTAEYFFEQGADQLGLARKEKEKSWADADSPLGRAYLNNMNAAANFAIANRLSIFLAIEEATAEALGGEVKLHYEISHNLVQVEGGKFVHRKGATRAFPAGHPALAGTQWEETGHPIIIPGSMGTASAILYAESTAADSIFSINHGCGRVMGRNHAKRELGCLQPEIDAAMNDMGILINTRSTPLDECHLVYKSIDSVLDSVEGAGLAKVAVMLRPRAVIKGVD